NARRNDLGGLGERGELLEPRIGHGDFADVRCDVAERIVRRLGAGGLRERIEERRLADIRQADDAAFESHDLAVSLHCYFGLGVSVSSSSSSKPLASMAR